MLVWVLMKVYAMLVRLICNPKGTANEKVLGYLV